MSARSDKNCVWVREVAVLNAVRPTIAYWEVWSAHNTRNEAIVEAKKNFKNRPKWVTAKFHKQTNRIRKYVPVEVSRG